MVIDPNIFNQRQAMIHENRAKFMEPLLNNNGGSKQSTNPSTLFDQKQIKIVKPEEISSKEVPNLVEEFPEPVSEGKDYGALKR